MLTLLGSLLGFGTSFLPKVMEFFQDRADKAHELKMITAMAEANAKSQTIKLDMVNVEADIREVEALSKHSQTIHKNAAQWVVNLAGSVRPTITYAFFIEFMVLTVLVSLGWITIEQYNTIWDAEMKALFAAVLSFWFGNRAIRQGKST